MERKNRGTGLGDVSDGGAGAARPFCEIFHKRGLGGGAGWFQGGGLRAHGETSWPCGEGNR